VDFCKQTRFLAFLKKRNREKLFGILLFKIRGSKSSKNLDDFSKLQRIPNPESFSGDEKEFYEKIYRVIFFSRPFQNKFFKIKKIPFRYISLNSTILDAL